MSVDHIARVARLRLALESIVRHQLALQGMGKRAMNNAQFADTTAARIDSENRANETLREAAALQDARDILDEVLRAAEHPSLPTLLDVGEVALLDGPEARAAARTAARNGASGARLTIGGVSVIIEAQDLRPIPADDVVALKAAALPTVAPDAISKP